jgi:hypothetical protein
VGDQKKAPPPKTKLGQIIQAELAQSLAPLTAWQRRVNAELAGHRRARTTGVDAPEGDESEAPAPVAKGPRALTQEDLDAAMELGELRASVPKAVLEAHGDELAGMSVAERARALRWLARGQTDQGQAKPKDDAGAAHAAAGDDDVRDDARSQQPGREAAKTRTSRGAPGPTPKQVPRPRSLQELRQLAANNPQAFKTLESDPTFDPADLPSTLPPRG